MHKHFMQIYGEYIGNQNTNRREIQIKCPFHDDSTPSMSINVESGLYNCFGCGSKGSAMNFYMKTRGVDYKTALKDLGEFDENYKRPLIKLPKPVEVKPEPIIVDYTEDIKKSTDIFFNNEWQYYGKKLFEKRGINFMTAIACMVGFIKGKGWIFPTVRFTDGKIVGYEVREQDFNLFSNGLKCYKADNTPSCMCVVWEGWQADKAYVAEGFIDACLMYQYFNEQGKADEVVILTPSNGVGSLHVLLEDEKLIQKLNKYSEVTFVCDNDKAGNKEVKRLMAMNENWKFFSGLAEGEDFGEWYLRRTA